MRETHVEKRLRIRVKEMGGLALKFVSPGFNGVPDRLVFLPGGRLILVELKAPGKKPSKLQVWVKAKLERLGFRYFVIDNYESVEVFVSEFHSA